MSLRYETLTGTGIADALEDLARLRTEVFRAWPYLYDGDPANEAEYLRSYGDTPGAILVAALEADRMVGCATGMPLACHEDAREVSAEDLGLDRQQVFYCAESVLLPEYRGQGAGHVFFDRREEHARAAGFTVSMFCGVERPDDHPLRPAGTRALAPFWKSRGYAPRDAVIRMTWRDRNENVPTEKILRVWTKPL